jgi:MFS family permease
MKPARIMTTANPPALLFSSRPGRWVVAITVLGSGIAALDGTVVNIALPTIGREFPAGAGALQWVMSGYTLSLAAFLLIGGSLGDRFGRRRVYSIGIVWFAWPLWLAGSPWCGVPDRSPGCCRVPEPHC